MIDLPVLHGARVTLRPAVPKDRRAAYEWLARSDLTAGMLGPPDFPDAPVPSWWDFCEDYALHFFDGSRPEAGRSFIVEAKGEAVGHLNHNGLDYDRTDRQPFVEFDIWMRAETYCGRGYGTDALRTFAAHLHAAAGVRTFLVRPSARNVRAVRAYEKAGFVRQLLSPAEQTARYGPGDYHDTVVLLKTMPP